MRKRELAITKERRARGREVIPETMFRGSELAMARKILLGEIRWFGTLKDDVAETH